MNCSRPTFKMLKTSVFAAVKKMVEIVGKGSEEEEEIEATILNIPKLKRLTLRQLPNLKSFCSGRNTIVSSSLESIEVIDCPKLRRIPLLGGEECPASLQKIRVQPSWWDSLDWNHFGHTKVDLQTFCQFEF
ncbi:hypothetical protein PanWU01x14_299250 [Parasponia andersonii]|uniref:Disease resistance protein At4g27190-like leucine-rich repeats domain-containing protein n=1 Tax=Parasponia andersonii TaxID=3476 RepID=A0A2P5AUI2_PARAD|nr:hypothetical protein PanWU01x14_299250 [Parasponia andersonii]